jgi:hypothetical protein
VADGDADLERASQAVADAEAPDWEGLAESGAGPAAVDALRDIERVTRAHRAAREALGHEPGDKTHRTAAAELTPPVFVWGLLRALEKVGEGSVGEVWRAYDPSLHREVALKLRRTEGAAVPAGLNVTTDPAMRRWLEEARALARVRHPNVLTVFGAAGHNGRVGLWTELVRGDTLEDRLKRDGPLPPKEVASIGADLCSALTAVHVAGLVHADIKAANVKIEPSPEGHRERPRVVLMDFGASHLPSVRAASGGTPLYMAPELLVGSPASAVTDLYAVGVLLHQLVTGRYPVEAQTLQELRERHARRELVTLAAAPRGCPSALWRIVKRALDPEASRRYRSAAEMQRALQAVVAPGRAAVVPALAVLLVTVCAASAAWWAWFQPSDTRYRPPARLPGEVVQGAMVMSDTLEGQPGDQMGWLVNGAGDVDGDGCDDLVVARVWATRTENSQGILELYLGSRSGRFGRPVQTLLGRGRYNLFPRALATYPDVNGDGRPELLVGEYFDRPSDHRNVNAVALFMSRPAGFDTIAAWRVIGDQPSAGFGDSDNLATVGDVNGDGHADLLIVSVFHSGRFPEEGAASLYLGRADGLSATPAWTLRGGQSGTRLGWQTERVGDINGDGYDDIVVGADNADGREPRAGRVDFYPGGPHGPPSRPTWSALGARSHSGFGRSVVGVGDVDGDGFADFLVGHMGHSGSDMLDGRAYLYRGGRHGPVAPPAWSGLPCGSGAGFSSRMAGLGDVNGDGVPDFAVSAPAYSASSTLLHTGMVTVLLGRRERIDHPGVWRVVSGEADSEFGSDVAGIGDFNGDGLADLAIGQPSGGGGRGRVYLVLGRREALAR